MTDTPWTRTESPHVDGVVSLTFANVQLTLCPGDWDVEVEVANVATAVPAEMLAAVLRELGYVVTKS